MKSDKEVNEQVDEESQTQKGGAKKGTSNVKSYTSWCTGLELHKIFAALPEEEKGVFRATCFAPLLLIEPIATMSMLVVEIFDRHLGDMKFQFGETIIQMKPIHVCLILGRRVSPIANEFLFVDLEHMTNFRMSLKFPKIEESIHLFPKLQGLRMTAFKRHQIVTFKKFFANPKLLGMAMKPSEIGMQQGLVQEAMKNQIEAPAIGAAPTISAPIVVAPAIGVPVIDSSSSASEIGAVVVRVCSQLEEHGKMLHNHGKMLEQMSMSTVEDSTLPLGDTPLLGLYQLRKLQNANEKEIEEKKKGKGEWQKKTNASKKNKKAEEADVPLMKKVKGTKKEAFTDEQFDRVPLIQLKTLIPKIPKKGLANRVPKKRQVVKDLMVDDDVEVGRKVNFKAISSKYGGDLLEWKKGDEKDEDDTKDVEEKVKSEEEQPQVAEEEDSEPPTVVVYYNGKKDVLHANEVFAEEEET
ncbi:hypothetical protein GIB67_021401 [Kingdonia uniflora]|uniref:Uncharacterized protein n=1 Tax=Kingdonia uniflora TaxID=39325 RepID=A0A7J7MCY5_9MAGN|nr:hypothetical protein GIB67_021401 [Kingdonia uniflora]